MLKKTFSRSAVLGGERGWSVGDYAGLVTLLDQGLGVIADDLAAAALPQVMD